MKNIQINPTGLKGSEVNERIKQLMGVTLINENHTSSVLELVKVGPDGKAYGVVRENHNYYIKTAPKKDKLMVEDFQYIGGLQNKKSEVYPSYAKALKQLNMKFQSLAEAHGVTGDFHITESDGAFAAGFSQYKGNGFSNEGNLEGNTPIVKEEEPEVEEVVEEDVELTKEEQDVEDMGKEPEVGAIKEVKRLSIATSLEEMDSIIEGLDKGKKKIYTLK